MNKKSRYLFYTFLTIFTLLSLEVIYLFTTKSLSDDVKSKKIEFVKLSQLPDLAISTEATFIRHRSLATTASIYKDDGSLREYFLSTFSISHSHKKN